MVEEMAIDAAGDETCAGGGEEGAVSLDGFASDRALRDDGRAPVAADGVGSRAEGGEGCCGGEPPASARAQPQDQVDPDPQDAPGRARGGPFEAPSRTQPPTPARQTDPKAGLGTARVRTPLKSGPSHANDQDRISSQTRTKFDEDEDLEIYCFLAQEAAPGPLPPSITSSKALQELLDTYPGS